MSPVEILSGKLKANSTQITSRSAQLRVLHIHSGNLQGGIETALLTIARSRQLATALASDFALCFEGRFSHRLREEGSQVFMLREVRVRNPISVIRARRRLRALLTLRKYDFAICHSPWSQAIFGPTVQRSNAANFYWAHDTVKGAHWLERWAGSTIPALAICNSDFTKQSLTSMFGNLDSVVVRYPADFAPALLTTGDRAQLRQELQTPPDAVVIVQVSRMEAWKGHPNLIRALYRLKDNPSWMLWFAGGAQRPKEADYASELQALADDLGLSDRIRFLGQRNDVPRILAASDIFCQANAVPEPFGIVFIEALRAGLPIVSFQMGGAEEIIDSSCGILVPPKDIDGLAASLLQLIANPHLRERLRLRSMARSQELCDPATQMKRLESLLLSRAEGGRSL